MSPVRTVLTLPSLVVPFIDFAHRTSPWETVHGYFTNPQAEWSDIQFLGLGAGFFAGWAIIGTKLIHAHRGSLGSAVGIAAWTLAAIFAALDGLLSFITLTFPEWIRLLGLVPAAVWVVGILLLRRRWAELVADDRDAIAALQITFLAHATVMLIGFADEPALGWWLSLVSVIGVALDFAANVRRTKSPSTAFVPSAP